MAGLAQIERVRLATSLLCKHAIAQNSGKKFQTGGRVNRRALRRLRAVERVAQLGIRIRVREQDLAVPDGDGRLLQRNAAHLDRGLSAGTAIQIKGGHSAKGLACLCLNGTGINPAGGQRRGAVERIVDHCALVGRDGDLSARLRDGRCIYGTEIRSGRLAGAVGVALLQRDAAATEQLVHRNEFIALGLQLVNGHQDAVHRGGMDVVRQHDRAVMCSVDDVRADGVGIAVLPVQRIDGPENGRIVQQRQHAGIIIAVGRAHKIVRAVARDSVEDVGRVADLPRHLRVRLFAQLRVIVCMRGDLVARVTDEARRHIGVFGLLAEHEERRLDAALRQPLKQAARIGSGAVVKCQGDQLAALRAGLRLRDGHRRRREQRQKARCQQKDC